MSDLVHDRLSHLDPDGLRESADGMRKGVRHTVELAGDVWTGPWSEVVPALSAVAAVDLCLGRLVEGHADALRILDQADTEPNPGVYGVWASRSAGTGLGATRRDGQWTLEGELRFASGIDLIDRALVPGWVDGHHLLFDVDLGQGLDDGSIVADRESWKTAAMDASRSFTCRCATLPAGEPVGPTDFYLTRPGFAIGGLGPAAVWSGGARLVTDLVAEGLARFPSTAHQARRLGLMEQSCWDARTALAGVAAALDRGSLSPTDVSHARTCVVAACDAVLREAPMVVGPGGLSSHARLARAIADLGIYVRQHHVDGALQSYGDERLARARPESGE